MEGRLAAVQFTPEQQKEIKHMALRNQIDKQGPTEQERGALRRQMKAEEELEKANRRDQQLDNVMGSLSEIREDPASMQHLDSVDTGPEYNGLRRFTRGIGGFFGYNDSMLTEQQKRYKEITGGNPRKNMWLKAMFAGTNAETFRGVLEKDRAEKSAAEKYDTDMAYKQHIADTQRMNALKGSRRPDTRTVLQKEAEDLYGKGTPEYNEYIRKYRERSSTHVTPHSKVQFEAYKGYIKEVPEARSAAVAAVDSMERIDMMMELNDHLGNTGKGKEFFTGMKSFFTGLGMESTIDTLDSILEVAGIDAFSGDQGATELYQALNNEQILNHSSILRGPTSDRDINFLRDASAALRMSDPDARLALLRQNRKKYSHDIEYYDYIRKALSETGVNAPPLPEIKARTPRSSNSTPDGFKPIDQMSEEEIDAEYNALKKKFESQQ